ncbi:MAG: thioredoxin [Peptococcaceae bacterium BICA1-7]|nr:MAG: thioredoxin [Peptococcaceae bacterium BICA1-7]HBV95925.1 thioredoxin [Desulfotomaculum sp.]
MPLHQLDDDSFEEIIYDNGEACLVVFSRKSCHVCQEVVPVLEELEYKYHGKFGFYRVDIEEQKTLFQRFSFKGVPQIIFFKNGEYQGKLSGKVEDEQVEEKISNTLD